MSNNSFKSFIIFFISICTCGVLISNWSIKQEVRKSNTYKVYYEYNIVNNDTIPIDTIYVKF